MTFNELADKLAKNYAWFQPILFIQSISGLPGSLDDLTEISSISYGKIDSETEIILIRYKKNKSVMFEKQATQKTEWKEVPEAPFQESFVIHPNY